MTFLQRLLEVSLITLQSIHGSELFAIQVFLMDHMLAFILINPLIAYQFIFPLMQDAF